MWFLRLQFWFSHSCRHWKMNREITDTKRQDFYTFLFTSLLLSACWCNSYSNINRHIVNHSQGFWCDKYHLLLMIVEFPQGQLTWHWQHHKHSFLPKRKPDFSNEWVLGSIYALLINAQIFSWWNTKVWLPHGNEQQQAACARKKREECDIAPYSKSHIPVKYRLSLLKIMSFESTSTANPVQRSNCIAVIRLQ